MGIGIRQLILGVYVAIMLAVATVFAIGAIVALAISASDGDDETRVKTIVVTTR
jgi:hypothetical protein